MHASKKLGGLFPSKELTLVTLSYRQEQSEAFPQSSSTGIASSIAKKGILKPAMPEKKRGSLIQSTTT